MGVRDVFGRLDAALTRYATTQQRDAFNRPGLLTEQFSGRSWSGIRVDQATASRMIAIHSAWSLIADSVGLIPWGAFEKVGSQRVELPDPEWMHQPVPDDPSLTWDEHVSQLAVSLASDGSSFTLVLPEVLNANELRVLDPERVEVKREGAEPRYVYRPEGGGRETLGPDQIIHISRLRRPGQLRGLSPIEEAAQSLGKIRSADRLGARVFDNAVLLSGYVSVPGPLSPDGHQLLQDQIEKQYGGGGNAGKPGIFANGGEWKIPTPNLEDMQLLELLRWGVLDVARLYHIPPHKLGDNSPGSMSYNSVEQQAIEWVVDGVRPYVTRIENAYRRLLPGRPTYLRANIDGLMRGDFKTRMEGLVQALNTHQLIVDEARALEERPPLSSYPDDVLFGPGGLLNTPNAPVGAATAPTRQARAIPEEGDDVRNLTVNVQQPDVAAALGELRQSAAESRRFAEAMEQRAAAAEARMADLATRQPTVHVEVPVPQVHVTSGDVHVAAPEVTVNPAIAMSPELRVVMPDAQDIRIVSMPPFDATVDRDGQGRLTGVHGE